MDLISDWISKVPDVIWSGVIASALTFLGVLWTNRGHKERQLALLEHEKRIHESERTHTLKKDILLEAFGSFANATSIIPKLSDLDLTQERINDQLKNHDTIIAKALLSATEDTAAEILKLSVELTDIFIELMQSRDIVLDCKSATEIHVKEINQANNEKNRIISLMKKLGEEKKLGATHEHLINDYEIQEKAIKQHQILLDEKNKKLQSLHITFYQECISKQKHILLLTPPMAISLRKELKTDKNPQIFINSFNKSIMRHTTSLERLIISQPNK